MISKSLVRVCVLVGLAVTGAVSAAVQGQEPPEPPNVLVIYREEVRPGKGAAHTANEEAWAAAFAKGQAPVQWLGMTSVSGPGEAWFLSPFDSYAAFEQAEDAIEANATLRSEGDKFSAADGELVNRTSVILARYRPNLSYRPRVSLPQMRYMQVDVVRVKPGYAGQFAETWASIVEAHEKAKMNEHWAVYSVESGMPAGTFLFFYPHRSLAHLDESGRCTRPARTGMRSATAAVCGRRS